MKDEEGTLQGQPLSAFHLPSSSPISGRTRVVGIIGDPVAHSRSPAMHNAAFAALGLDFVYVPFAVRAADLGDAVRAVRALGLVGVNVTVPHKEGVLRHLDEISERARAVGAVNTIVNRGGRLCGDNTDVTGFLAALRHAGMRVRGRRAVVVGAGGSARAVVAALCGAGAASVTIANRTRPRAVRLARRLGGGATAIDATGLPALAREETLRGSHLVVNTTSVGLRGERFPPLAFAATAPGCLFFDLIYGRSTDFLVRAESARRRTCDGAELLVRQGAAAFRLWTGRAAPMDVMRQALRHPRAISVTKKEIDKISDDR